MNHQQPPTTHAQRFLRHQLGCWRDTLGAHARSLKQLVSRARFLASDRAPRDRPRLLIEFLTDHFGWLLVTVIAGLVLLQPLLYGDDILMYDYMTISGYSFLVIIVHLSRDNVQRFRRAVVRLEHCGTLCWTPTAEDAEEAATSATHGELVDYHPFVNQLNQTRHPWPHRFGLFLAAVILTAYVAAYFPLVNRPPNVWAWALIGTTSAYISGRILGRMVSFGFLQPYIQTGELSISSLPGHPDGAAGLKPLGDYYFYQAALLALAAVHIGVWSVLIPPWKTHRDYLHWREPYLVLLVVIVLLEILVFIVPMYAIHREILNQKLNRHEITAAQLSADIEELKAELAALKLSGQEDATRQAALREQIQFKTRRYHQHAHAQTWPVDVDVRRRFALGNLTLLLPLVPPVIDAFDISVH